MKKCGRCELSSQSHQECENFWDEFLSNGPTRLFRFFVAEKSYVYSIRVVNIHSRFAIQKHSMINAHVLCANEIYDEHKF